MKLKLIQVGILAITIATFIAPTVSHAEGWRVRSFFHQTTSRDCLNKAEAAFKGISGHISRGKDVIYGYDLGGKNIYDAILICQRSENASRDEVNNIAVILVIFDSVYSKKSGRARKRFEDRIINRYKASM